MNYGIVVDDFETLNSSHLKVVRDIELHGWNCLILCYNDDEKTYKEPGYWRYRRVKRYFQDDPYVTVSFLGGIQRQNPDYLENLRQKFLSVWTDIVSGDFVPLSARNKGRVWVLSKGFQYTGILKGFEESIEVAPYNFEEETEKIKTNPKGNWELLAPTFYDIYGRNILILGSPSGYKDLMVKKMAEEYRAPYGISVMKELTTAAGTPYTEFNQQAFESAVIGQFRENLLKSNSVSNKGLFFSGGGVLPILSYAKFASEDTLHYLKPEMYDELKKGVKLELIPNWARIYFLNDASYAYEDRIKRNLLETLEEYGIKSDIIYEVKNNGLKEALQEINNDFQRLS